ncbi:hypothetical protein [Paenibacillus piri]|uniref:hypothetical protein n=1 Tax=Paenibacillus piri TaxID=2547395 RepID=UPI001405228E|nr:hypothetical protein [Paenibacillus piri]
MFSKIKSMLKDYFIVEPPSEDYIYFPTEYGGYPFYKVSSAVDDAVSDEADQDTVQ